jgi:hypothetical protein
VFFGWLSDKIGRKYIMMAGMLLAILLYRPIYKSMYETVNVKNKIVSKIEENIPTSADFKKKKLILLLQLIIRMEQNHLKLLQLN